VPKLNVQAPNRAVRCYHPARATEIA
jgi:hypothetical protein